MSEEEALGIDSSKVIVGGFSQGGAIAMTAARSKKKLAAIVGTSAVILAMCLGCISRCGHWLIIDQWECIAGLSTYIPLRNASEGILSDENRSTPILMCHGEGDMVVSEASSSTYGK